MHRRNFSRRREWLAVETKRGRVKAEVEGREGDFCDRAPHQQQSKSRMRYVI